MTEIVDGQMKKIDLCEECAKEQGVTDPKGFALADLLLGLGVGELSVTPSMVPRVKMLIRSIEMSQARELAEFALGSESPKQILARAEALARAAVPSFFEGAA